MASMIDSLDGRIVFITGPARGIGAEVAATAGGPRSEARDVGAAVPGTCLAAAGTCRGNAQRITRQSQTMPGGCRRYDQAMRRQWRSEWVRMKQYAEMASMIDSLGRIVFIAGPARAIGAEVAERGL
jgi:hypothetical protein